jgi:hypothetical protein
MEEALRFKGEKALAIFNALVNTANNITALAKQLPKGKQRNPFIKSYNRRPRNKAKRGELMVRMAQHTYLATTQIATIVSKPIPKGYPSTYKNQLTIVGNKGEEIIMRKDPSK